MRSRASERPAQVGVQSHYAITVALLSEVMQKRKLYQLRSQKMFFAV